jgi:hypothetical protein
LQDLLAYLDPGSGSLVLQVLAGGAAAVAVTTKIYWNRIKSVFRRGGRRQDAPPESDLTG